MPGRTALIVLLLAGGGCKQKVTETPEPASATNSDPKPETPAAQNPAAPPEPTQPTPETTLRGEGYKSVTIGAQQKVAVEKVESLSPEELVMYDVGLLVGQVQEGGFAQYFINFGDRATSAVASLEKVGEEDALKILQEALAVFPEGGPAVDRDERFQQIKAMPPAHSDLWARLDLEFDECQKPLEKEAWRYWQTHAKLPGAAEEPPKDEK